MILSLNHLPLGEKGQVLFVAIDGTHRKKITDLGLAEGKTVELLNNRSYEDPIAYSVSGTVITIPKEDTKKIIVQF